MNELPQQYLKMTEVPDSGTGTCTMAELTDRVGSQNVDTVLHVNGLARSPNIGKSFTLFCNEMVNNTPAVPWQRRVTMLNRFSTDSELFEIAATLDEDGWKLLDSVNTFPGYIRIPEHISLPPANDIIGGTASSVPIVVYSAAVSQLETYGTVAPEVFNEYSSIRPVSISDDTYTTADPFEWFPIPWGEVTLYSTLADDSVDFPVYPEEISDSVKANYTTMPDILYQYEPWQIYTGSGPRSNTYTFSFHRDMWNGDHRTGGANKLIRFCQANCYPEYNGSAVNMALVTLYVGGKALITGVLTDVSTDWSGPLGHDKFYLYCKLSLTITEVSPQALNFSVVRNKPLIG